MHSSNVVVLLGWAAAGAVAGYFTTRMLRRSAPDLRPTGATPLLAFVWPAVSLFGGAPAVAVFGWWCVCLSSIDVGSRRLPNTLTATGVLAIGLYAVAVDRFPSMLAGAAGLFACYLVVHLSLPRALGAGDVKLAWALGGVAGMAGVDAWALGAVAAPLLTGLCGAVLSGSGRRHARVPHGPAMCAATLLALAT